MLLPQITRGGRDDGALGNDQFPAGADRQPHVLLADEFEGRLRGGRSRLRPHGPGVGVDSDPARSGDVPARPQELVDPA